MGKKGRKRGEREVGDEERERGDVIVALEGRRSDGGEVREERTGD